MAITQAASSNISVSDLVDPIIELFYPALIAPFHACLAVFGAMSLQDRTKPLSLIFEAASGWGKTAVIQSSFPLPGYDLEQYVYRSDKFTPRAFVSHAANIKASDLAKNDLLPKLRGKVLITKEMAPIFRGRTEELTENFSILISVLDGKGFTSDSGMRGQRGYQESIVFNWIGATTPLPRDTYRLMYQLGTRLLFYEVPAIQPTKSQVLEYAKRDDASKAEEECQWAVNFFLDEFYRCHPVGSVPPDSIVIPESLLKELVHWAGLVSYARAEIKYERDGSNWEPMRALTPEGPYKLINYFKELARGHALIYGRHEVNPADLELVSHVAISSIPGHLRPLVHELRRTAGLDSEKCRALCGVSHPTARRYLKELHLLGFGDLSRGSPKSNKPDCLMLSDNFKWLYKPDDLEQQV